MDNKLTDREIQEMLKKYPLGNIDSPIDLRDYTYDMISEVSNIEIPNEFELKYQFEVKNQGQIGACVNHAISSVKEIIDGVTEYYSQWFLHALRNDSDYQGKGAIIREELKHLVNDGIVPLKLFNVPEDYSQIKTILENEYNKESLLKEAAKHKSTGYINLNNDEIKKYLYSEKKPIIVAVKVYQNFYEAPYNNGIIPSVPTGTYYGNHAMAIVGYKNNILKILNSWGNWGGQNGYLYLDLNSSILKELWGLTDNPIDKPPVKKYKVGWDKDLSTGKWIFSEDGETLTKDTWKQIKNTWYYFKDIYAIDGYWIKYKNKWYYLEKNSCAMATDKWVNGDDKWYRVGLDGAMLTGWYQDANSKWYYLDIEKGYCYTNCTILIDDKNYTFDKNGVWIENFNNGVVSNECIDFIKSWEGFSATPYLDAVGVKTLGYGMTGDEIQGLTSITEVEATTMLKNWIDRKYAPVVKADLDSKGVTLAQNEFDALVSFAYNCGTGGLLGSTLYKNVVNGIKDSDTILANFIAWSNGRGQRIEGLYRRRNKEAALFLNADYTGNC